jgi:hypothetical protein
LSNISSNIPLVLSLRKKFEILRPVFREAEKTLKAERDKARALGRKDISHENETYKKFRKTLNEAFFDLKVLDPAMGSGHFLVEAVDYITDQMAKILTAFKWNPIVYELAQTRHEIQEEMERQDVTIDMSKLTDLNLLKRRVLKSCIYGVDLNPMAVELAKVSLWLDCFTLGAPLSFLDHHMKCGNSLIGGSVQEVQDALSRDLFGHQFTDLLNATQLMRKVGELSDVTSQEVTESRKAYKGAYDALAPFKRLLDVWISEYFGNKKAQITTSLYAGAIVADDYSKTNIEDKQAIETALVLAKEKRFFHWDLEFPEVFFDEMKRKEIGGFDAVVGNPPWGAEFSSKDKAALSASFKTGQTSSPDSYAVFTESAINHLKEDGCCGYIVPDTVLRKDELIYLRQFLLFTTKVAELVETGPLFKEVRDTWCLILLVSKGQPIETHEIRHKQISRFIVSSEERLELFGQQIWSRDTFTLQRIWKTRQNLVVGYLASQKEQAIIDTIEKCSTPLSRSDLGFDISRGEEGSKFAFEVKVEDHYRMVLPEEIERYWVGDGPAISDEILSPGKLQNYYKHSKIWVIRIQKLRWPQRIVASLDRRANSASMKTLQIIVSRDDDQQNLLFLSTILVSRVMNFWCTNFLVDDLNQSYLERLPIRRISFTTATQERAYYLEKAKSLYEYCLNKNDQQCVLGFVDHHLSREPEESDVVHDLLAFLAEEMIHLNKEKQTAQKEFLDWLVSTLRLLPDRVGRKGIDVLRGKGKLANYPGNYQKGESALTFEELLDILRKNKGRMGVSLSDVGLVERVRKEYEGSLEWVLPMKERLAKTDALIDQVVYRLYGLTEEEIRVVEGKG